MLAEGEIAVSAISYVEVPGYHRIETNDRTDFEELFRILPILPITQSVLDKAVELRQQRKLSLGDSLIAATCLTSGYGLWTRNTVDFANIPDLNVIDPLEM